jgi:hypothetical protein
MELVVFFESPVLSRCEKHREGRILVGVVIEVNVFDSRLVGSYKVGLQDQSLELIESHIL